MSRQNPRRPTQPAGHNPTGRTRGFHFKILPQSSASRDTTFATYQSQPMASYTASMTGPSHPRELQVRPRQQRHTFQQSLALPFPTPALTDWPQTSQPQANFMLLAPSFELRSHSEKRAKPLETSTATATPAAAPQHIKCVISPLVLVSITLPTRFSTVHVALVNATLRPFRTNLEMRVLRAALGQPPRRHQVPRAEAPRAPIPPTLFRRASNNCVLKNVVWTRCSAPSNRIFKRSATACVQIKTALNARPYSTNSMLSPSKPKPIGSLKSIKTEWLNFKGRREWRPLRAHGSSELSPSTASPLGAPPLGEFCISLSALALSSGARDPR